MINTYGNEIRWISFDHDLGGDDTAMVVVDFLEELSYEGSFRPEVFEWRIHSANPVGRKRLQLGLTAVDRWLKKSRV